jgi:hypothetical protein
MNLPVAPARPLPPPAWRARGKVAGGREKGRRCEEEDKAMAWRGEGEASLSLWRRRCFGLWAPRTFPLRLDLGRRALIVQPSLNIGLLILGRI